MTQLDIWFGIQVEFNLAGPLQLFIFFSPLVSGKSTLLLFPYKSLHLLIYQDLSSCVADKQVIKPNRYK